MMADNIERVRLMLLNNHRLALRWISEELGMSNDSVSTIIHQELGKLKICFRFVLHSLFDEQKETRIHAAEDFIGTCDEDSTFLQTIIVTNTGDESFCYQYDSESKWQTEEWCTQGRI